MSTLADKLHKWAVEELNLASESGSTKIPDAESFRKITKGKQQKRLWNYVINHVRSESTVNKIRRTLYLKKLMTEKENSVVPTVDYSAEAIKLQSAILEESEKCKYLTRSLVTVKDRILNLEQKVQSIKDETFQLNQKTALLEFAKQSYEEKNENLKHIFSQVLSYKNSLCSYQSAKVFDKAAMPLSCDFFDGDARVYRQMNFTVKDLIHVSSSILKSKFHQKSDTEGALMTNFLKKLFELKNNCLLLTDFVAILKEMRDSDLQQFILLTMQSLSVNDFIHSKMDKSPSKALLAQMKCDNVYNSLHSIKNKKKIERLLVRKKEIIENKFTDVKLSDLDFEIKCTLLEKLAENNALVVSNDYLADYLKCMFEKTESIVKKVRQQKLGNEELQPFILNFYSDLDLTFCLSYTFTDAIQKTIRQTNDIQSFAQTKLFESSIPQKETLTELRASLLRDRKLTWMYCKKANIIQPLFPKIGLTKLPSMGSAKSLNFEHFQGIGTLCESWTQFKQKLLAEVTAERKMFAESSSVGVSEFYPKFLKLLNKMEFSIEKAMLLVSGGMNCCDKNKSLIREWWEQNAQYIPRIKYKEKTLKMWIDILSVLTDYDPQDGL